MRFQNGCSKVAIELRVVPFWSEIILVISNQIMCMISVQIALHSVQLPLLNFLTRVLFFFDPFVLLFNLVIGPLKNSEFCFPGISRSPSNSSQETLSFR